MDGSLKVVASVRVRFAIDFEYLLPVRVRVGNIELDCPRTSSASGDVIFLRGDSRRGLLFILDDLIFGLSEGDELL